MSSYAGHVLIISALYYPRVVGGAERSVQFLAEALVEAGTRVTVACLTDAEEHSVAEVNGARVHYVPVGNVYWPFGAKRSRWNALFHAIDIDNPLMQRRITAIIKKEKPDVVHSNALVGFSPSVWRAAAAVGVPVVHTLRDFYLLCPSAKMFKQGKNCGDPCTVCSVYNWQKRRLSHLVTGVIGNSQFMLDSHAAASFFPRATHRGVIHNIYRFNQETPVKPLRSEGKLRVGFLGRLGDYKGTDLLLEVVAKFPAGAIEVLLAGTGSEDYEAALRQRYEGPHVRFLGFVPPESLFGEIDVLAAPSLWHEPLPRVVFESYAHGVPVIVTNRGGMAELVTPGETGFMFDPDEPDALRAILQQLLECPTLLDPMREECFKRRENFRPATIAARYQETYSTVSALVAGKG